MHSQKLPNMNVWPPVLACGAWLKNAACLLQRDQVLWSPVHGDLGDPQSCLALEASLERLLTLAEITPHAIAHDLHPDFYSSQLAVSLAERLDVPALAVQHHHAHVAAVMAEHGLDGPVLGLALDGVGLGSDGAAWGGELLWVAHAWRRLGHLLPLPLPGGDIAAREPWRLTAAALHLLGRDAEITPRLGPLVGEQSAGTVAGMLRRELNCPPSSGAGRWFDAAAGILGLSVRQQAEAEAAIALERSASEYLAVNADPVVDGLWRIQADGVLDLRLLLTRLFDLADHGRSAEGAAVFHLALAAALSDWVLQQPGNLPVMLGGGCFANRLLSARLTQRLSACGVQVFTAQSVSCGDAGLALGQGWIAAHWPELESQAALPLEEIPCA
ncbi:carbamoyltransferase HypF [Pseudomonas sp. 10B1]|uniref:Kae1-like domain-containing protein n=2 Tax=Pseudomonas TaxID=286 RepID=UPI002AB54FD0|nr:MULTISPECIES: carbamoyltransferase HypF [unclassified Pseudomonas]MDY7559644.1 carbamoyltransferase HypF [Pseudomonas sp. AB6]MEA9977980.1 carbamoyltransferase HypF [Pseudomonas sp. RTS4]MEA9993120.1 carbamoyltransferase HypF [Pseudomonas sp. AA4]MEB0086062.1 carbamoyltransferase HypF [Pseudomonas sp. RTI1]MEB0125502.1 carbamoyltransferase HypF [Pseudomonas sp. CCC1.2]